MKRASVLSIVLALRAFASGPAMLVEPSANPSPAPAIDQPQTRNLWRYSVVALAAANALDVHSSWGKHELNGTLAGPQGTFGARGATIKLGLQGGLLGLEYLLTRGHGGGRLFRALSVVNFGAASVIGATAIHNYSIPRPR